MFTSEAMLLAFAAFNTLRVLAYVPQIMRIVRDNGDAAAISFSTWSLFGLSHLSTVFYAALVINDRMMAAVFFANTVCCGLIVALTALKRRAWHRRQLGRPQATLARG